MGQIYDRRKSWVLSAIAWTAYFVHKVRKCARLGLSSWKDEAAECTLRLDGSGVM